MEARTAFLIFGITGLAGVLVDIDHILAVFIKMGNPAFEDSRFLHPYFGIIAGLFVLYIIASVGRLYVEHLLRKKHEDSISKSTTDN